MSYHLRDRFKPWPSCDTLRFLSYMGLDKYPITSTWSDSSVLRVREHPWLPRKENIQAVYIRVNASGRHRFRKVGTLLSISDLWYKEQTFSHSFFSINNCIPPFTKHLYITSAAFLHPCGRKHLLTQCRSSVPPLYSHALLRSRSIELGYLLRIPVGCILKTS